MHNLPMCDAEILSKVLLMLLSTRENETKPLALTQTPEVRRMRRALLKIVKFQLTDLYGVAFLDTLCLESVYNT